MKHKEEHIVIVNPLGGGLAHYTASLERLLIDCGATVSINTVMEPSIAGYSRLRWLRHYLRSIRLINGTKATVIQTWPVLGYWDFVILKLMLRHARSLVVLHDPHPLVQAKGYGRIARRLASHRRIAAAAIVHSGIAAEAVNDDAQLHLVVNLPHPMFPPKKHSRPNKGGTAIRVLGQYKVDRDLKSMEKLAAEAPADWCYEVIGRGWPTVMGWKVVDRFILEDEFDEFIKSSDVIMIPYTRFFQSGVAIRALELATPVVGPIKSSLQSLLGSDYPWLVSEGLWISAIRAAVDADRDGVLRIAEAVYRRTRTEWSEWLAHQP